jgi:group I intron endonuclease
MVKRTKIGGVYCIHNLVNHKKYIGCANNLRERWLNHVRYLEVNEHQNRLLQEDYNAYGRENFEFFIIQEISNDFSLAQSMELYWIVFYDSFAGDGHGYNLSRGGVGNLSMQFEEDAKERISKSSSNRKKRGTRSSQYLGVYYHRGNGRWAVYASKRRKSYYGGMYDSEIDAAIAYNSLALKVFGDLANLNIIDGSIPYVVQDDESTNDERPKERPSNRLKVKIDENGRIVARDPVGLRKVRNYWRASIKYKKIVYNIGNFKTKEEAILAYNAKSIELYGDDSHTNSIKNLDRTT